MKQSRGLDKVFIISSVAFLSVGILGTCGVLNFIGASKALYLSYGMYAAASLFAIMTVVKLTSNYCVTHKRKSLSHNLKEDGVSGVSVFKSPNAPASSDTPKAEQLQKMQDNRLEKEAATVDSQIQKLIIESLPSVAIKTETDYECYSCTITLNTREKYGNKLSRAELQTLCRAIDATKIEYGNKPNSSQKLSISDLNTSSLTDLTAVQVLDKLCCGLRIWDSSNSDLI